MNFNIGEVCHDVDTHEALVVIRVVPQKDGGRKIYVKPAECHKDGRYAAEEIEEARLIPLGMDISDAHSLF